MPPAMSDQEPATPCLPPTAVMKAHFGLPLALCRTDSSVGLGGELEPGPNCQAIRRRNLKLLLRAAVGTDD